MRRRRIAFAGVDAWGPTIRARSVERCAKGSQPPLANAQAASQRIVHPEAIEGHRWKTRPSTTKLLANVYGLTMRSAVNSCRLSSSDRASSVSPGSDQHSRTRIHDRRTIVFLRRCKCVRLSIGICPAGLRLTGLREVGLLYGRSRRTHRTLRIWRARSRAPRNSESIRR
jgi:hypothetical protein